MSANSFRILTPFPPEIAAQPERKDWAINISYGYRYLHFENFALKLKFLQCSKASQAE